MMKNYVNLHTHTTFSMLDGHGTVEKYAERAKKLQMGALAQTDHGNIHGWIDFYDACKTYDLKPIFGIEAYQARKSRFDKDDEERAGPATNEWEQRGPYHLSILAQNKTGYHNLIKLSARAYLEGFYTKPRMDHELLSEHAEGLIVLSGCLNGEVQQALLRDDYGAALTNAATMQDIVGKDNYFIEIMDHDIAEQDQVKDALLEIAKTIGAPIVPTGDCHYVYEEDAGNHDLMLCVGTKTTVHNEDRFQFSGPEFYLKSYEEMIPRFEEEWLETSVKIADMIDVDLEFGEYHFPRSQDVPVGKNVDEHIEELMWKGLKELYGEPLRQDVIDRATYELGVVKQEGFQDYLLVVADIVQWARDNNIACGPGRGSAAGCIVSYALGITKLDPIKYNLLFERFLVAGRKTVPDIDLDFDDRYRDQVIEYCRRKYGEDRVCNIITFSRIKTASAIKDAARALGYDYVAGDRLTKMIPDAVLGVIMSLEDFLQIEEVKKVYSSDEEARAILDGAVGLEGNIRHTGIHAAGIVVSHGPIMNYIPLMQKGEDKPITTQWDGETVERCGLLKIDFLGLRNLGVIDMCVQSVKQTRGIDIDIDKIPLDDESVYAYLKKGKSIGCFQIESEGMRNMMVDLQPDDIYDIMALISLFRPGPMGSGMDKMYINRKHGRTKITYPHPCLEEVLKRSKGIMLYQEDVLNVAKVGAGLSPGDADDLRRMIGKKYMDKVSEYRDIFVQGAMKTNDIPEITANKIYSDIEYFAGYGFNMAHAICYALISYQTAYLKFMYPVEYMAALMSSVMHKKDRIPPYLAECKAMGIEVLPPSVSESDYHFKVRDEKTILFGLAAIDGIGETQVSYLKDGQADCSTLWTFLRTANSHALNKKTIEQLMNAGALDDLVPEKYITFKSLNRKSKVDILERENSALGIYLSGHPLEDIWPVIKNNVSHTCADILSDVIGKGHIKMTGMITDYSELRTKKTGMKMCKFILEDMTGRVSVVVFTKEYASITDKLTLGNDLVVTVLGFMRKESENIETMITCKDIHLLDIKLIDGGSPIILKAEHDLNISQVSRLSAIIDNSPGDSPVYLRVYDGKYEINFKFKNSANREVEETLQDVLSLVDAQQLI